MFISTFAELQKHVRIDNDLDSVFILESESEILDKYFLDHFGGALIVSLDLYRVSPIPEQLLAFKRMQKAVANLMLLEYLATGELKISSGGIFRPENDQVTTPYLQQIIRHAASLYDKAFTQLERLQELMYANENKFLDWLNAPGYIRNESLFIRSASEFDKLIRIYHKFRTYQFLYPTIRTVQQLYVESRFSSAVISVVLAPVPMTTVQATFREHIQKAVAYFTQATAMSEGLVKVTQDGVRVIEHTPATSNQVESKGELAAISSNIKEYMDTGRRFISAAEKLFQDHPTEFGAAAPEDFVQKAEWL